MILAKAFSLALPLSAFTLATPTAAQGPQAFIGCLYRPLGQGNDHKPRRLQGRHLHRSPRRNRALRIFAIATQTIQKSPHGSPHRPRPRTGWQTLITQLRRHRQ